MSPMPPEPKIPETEITDISLLPEIITPEEIKNERLTLLHPKILAQVAEFITDPAKGKEQLQAYADLVQMLRATSIHLTYPSDWVLNFIENEGRILSSGYLQDIGAERAAMPWGITRLGEIQDHREYDGEKKTYIWFCKADFICERTGVVLTDVEGARWSGDEFFQKRARKMNAEVNPLWIKQSALRNMHGRAVRSLAGLAGVPEHELKAAGIDTTKCVIVRWGAASQGRVEGEQPTRGKGAGEELFHLLKAKAEETRSNVPRVLRDLCKAQGIAEKDSVAQLTPSQVADLLTILRDEKREQA